MPEKKIRKTGWLPLMAAFLVFTLTAPGLNGEVKELKGHGYLGITMKKMDRQDRQDLKADFGILVEEVFAGKAADKAGLMEDDVIQYIDKNRVRRPQELSRYISKTAPGQKVKLKIIRKGTNREITAVLGKVEAMELGRLHHNHPGALIEKKREGHGYMGVNLRNFSNKQFAEYFGIKDGEGALVEKVEKDSPAHKAGLKAGDVIISYKGEKVKSPSEISKKVFKGKKGDKVKLRVMRHRKEKNLSIILGEKEGNMFFHQFNRFKGAPFAEFFDNKPHKFEIKIPELKKFHLDKHHNEHIIIEEKDLLKKGKKGKVRVIIREKVSI